MSDIQLCPICNQPCGVNKQGKIMSACSNEHVRKVVGLKNKKMNEERKKEDPTFWQRVDSDKQKRYKEKTGFDSWNNNPEVIAKKHQRWGSTSPFGLESVQEKIIQTNQQRYGVNYHMQNEQQKENWFNNYKEKTGSDSPLSNPEVRAKIQQTNLEKFGGISPIYSSDVIAKIKASKESNGERWALTDQEKQEVINYRINHYVNDHVVAKEMGISPCVVSRILREAGMDIVNMSSLEQLIKDTIVENFPDLKIRVHARDVIAPQEIDIYIPSLKLGIEVHGLHFHSEEYVNSKYHHNKFLVAQQTGVQLIQLFEHELDEKHLDLFVSMLRAKMGLCKTIGARQLVLKEFSNEEISKFLNQNHWQTSSPALQSPIKFGLVDENGMLYQVACFAPSRFEQGKWELIRTATLKGHVVNGGFQKLLKAFLKQHRVDLISYSDNRLFRGQSLEAFGFQRQFGSRIGYTWWKKNSLEVVPRYKAMKHKLGKLLGPDFNVNLTEVQNMHNAGYVRIFDAGQTKWVLPFSK